MEEKYVCGEKIRIVSEHASEATINATSEMDSDVDRGQMYDALLRNISDPLDLEFCRELWDTPNCREVLLELVLMNLRRNPEPVEYILGEHLPATMVVYGWNSASEWAAHSVKNIILMQDAAAYDNLLSRGVFGRPLRDNLRA